MTERDDIRECTRLGLMHYLYDLPEGFLSIDDPPTRPEWAAEAGNNRQHNLRLHQRARTAAPALLTALLLIPTWLVYVVFKVPYLQLDLDEMTPLIWLSFFVITTAALCFRLMTKNR